LVLAGRAASFGAGLLAPFELVTARIGLQTYTRVVLREGRRGVFLAPHHHIRYVLAEAVIVLLPFASLQLTRYFVLQLFVGNVAFGLGLALVVEWVWVVTGFAFAAARVLLLAFLTGPQFLSLAIRQPPLPVSLVASSVDFYWATLW